MNPIRKHPLFIINFGLFLVVLATLRTPNSTELLSPGRNIFYLIFVFVIGTILGCFMVITYETIMKKQIEVSKN